MFSNSKTPFGRMGKVCSFTKFLVVAVLVNLSLIEGSAQVVVPLDDVADRKRTEILSGSKEVAVSVRSLPLVRRFRATEHKHLTHSTKVAVNHSAKDPSRHQLGKPFMDWILSFKFFKRIPFLRISLSQRTYTNR